MVKHWLIRVGDGLNFINSKYAVWGIKRGRGGCLKSIVQKFQPGDILWFFTSKKFGGKIIGMAEYTRMYDREDEQLVRIHTLTNSEQNWTGKRGLERSNSLQKFVFGIFKTNNSYICSTSCDYF